MRKDLGVKTYAYPQPVFIIGTYNEDGTPNAMNAAWGGISGSTQITMCLNKVHKTVENILARGCYTVSMADEAHYLACDYVGIESGNNVSDKFAKAGFHAIQSAHVDAPLIDELPLALECKLMSYNEETHCLIGEIINVSADTRILDENEKIDMSQFHPILFEPSNNEYLKVGEKVGNAFMDGKALK